MAGASYFIHTLGCRANQADTAGLAAALEGRGWQAAESPEGAETLLLNTCTVTAAADSEARRWIGRMHRRHPGKRIVVTGCYAQRDATALAALAGVTLVAGNTHKHRVAELLEQPEAPKIATAAVFEKTQIQVAPAADGDRTRPTLKVQEGCNNRCAYCIIPAVRGGSRSLPLGETLGQVRALVEAGYRELVLSGINLGQWGRDLDAGLRLPTLVRAILEQTELARLRLSSVEPMDWTNELIDTMAAGAGDEHPRLARHAHAPLQSGSDAVLRRMHRRYRPWHYAERIERLQARVPGVAIGADVMVGFPGETDAEFEETARFIAELPFTYLHLFTFSSRPGTEAERRLSPVEREWRAVPAQVAAERHQRLQALMAEKRARWLQGFAGGRLPALVLSEASGTAALSDNFIRLRLDAPAAAQTLARARITGLEANGLTATLEATCAA